MILIFVGYFSTFTREMLIILDNLRPLALALAENIGRGGITSVLWRQTHTV